MYDEKFEEFYHGDNAIEKIKDLDPVFNAVFGATDLPELGIKNLRWGPNEDRPTNYTLKHLHPELLFEVFWTHMAAGTNGNKRPLQTNDNVATNLAKQSFCKKYDLKFDPVGLNPPAKEKLGMDERIGRIGQEKRLPHIGLESEVERWEADGHKIEGLGKRFEDVRYSEAGLEGTKCQAAVRILHNIAKAAWCEVSRDAYPNEKVFDDMVSTRERTTVFRIFPSIQAGAETYTTAVQKYLTGQRHIRTTPLHARTGLCRAEGEAVARNKLWMQKLPDMLDNIWKSGQYKNPLVYVGLAHMRYIDNSDLPYRKPILTELENLGFRVNRVASDDVDFH